MIARAIASEEIRAQLNDFNEILQFKRDDGKVVLSTFASETSFEKGPNGSPLPCSPHGNRGRPWEACIPPVHGYTK